MRGIIDYSEEKAYVLSEYGATVTVWDMAGGFLALGWIIDGIDYTASNYSGGLANDVSEFAEDLEAGLTPGWLVVARNQDGDELGMYEASLTVDGFIDAADTVIDRARKEA